MKNLYNEFFHVPKHGKIREKVMLARMAVTIIVALACLAATSFAAFAYFSHSVTSASNIIKSASFNIKLSVQIQNENGQAVAIREDGFLTYVAELEANTTYFITLEHAEESTAQTGFVIITADGCSHRYHTQQLGRDSDGKTKTVTFRLLPNVDTTVTFLAHWGTSSFYGYPDQNSTRYVMQDETVTLSIDRTENSIPSTSDTLPPDTDETNHTEDTTDTAPTTTARPTEPTKPSTTEPEDTTESDTDSDESSDDAESEDTTESDTDTDESSDDSESENTTEPDTDTDESSDDSESENTTEPDTDSDESSDDAEFEDTTESDTDTDESSDASQSEETSKPDTDETSASNE